MLIHQLLELVDQQIALVEKKKQKLVLALELDHLYL